MNIMPDNSTPASAPQPSYRVLQVVLYMLAAILIGRAIPLQCPPAQPIEWYYHWGWIMPLQARCLMVPVLLWASHSHLMATLSIKFKESSFGPVNLMMQVVDASSLLLLGPVFVRLRNCFSPRRIFPWLVPFLLLWCVVCCYLARYESRFYTPYDLLGLLFFSLGLMACLQTSALLLLAIMVVGTFNRETTIFLLPIWLACNWPKRNVRLYVTALMGGIIWILVRLQIHRWTGPGPSGYMYPFAINLRMLLLPHHWSQTFSIAGFLVVPVYLHRRLITDPLLKRLWLGFTPWFLSVLIMAWWNETRAFGELIPLICLTAAIQLEQFIRDNNFSNTLVTGGSSFAPVPLTPNANLEQE